MSSVPADTEQPLAESVASRTVAPDQTWQDDRVDELGRLSIGQSLVIDLVTRRQVLLEYEALILIGTDLSVRCY